MTKVLIVDDATFMRFAIRTMLEKNGFEVVKISSHYVNEPMLDIFIFETVQNIEQLERIILNSEKSGCFLRTPLMRYLGLCIPLKDLQQ